MITINNIKYTIKDIKVTFGNYSVSSNGKKRNGQSPFIQFRSNNNFFIGIETTYDKEWLIELKANDKKNITEFISDITYEDEKGWLSLITGTYTCYIKKNNQNEFKLELNCTTELENEKFEIEIIEDIIMDL